MKTEHRQKIEFKQAQKLLEQHNNDDTRSVASSHRSRKHRDRDAGGVSRPPLTERALSHIDEGSVAGSRRGSRSHHGGHGSRRGSVSGESHRERGGDRYRHPYMEEASVSQPRLSRRHTDYPGPMETQVTLRPAMPVQTTHQRHPVPRSVSDPDLRHNRDHDHIDMNLAYGDAPPDLMTSHIGNREQEIEVQATMSKLDHLLLEANCVQHSATAIIKNLQDNPEAMAAVALTLAELSNLLKTMSPAILTAMKSSSPAVFALLASPQFLIAGGLALGVTVVMFGGYKIVKKIQENNAVAKEANRMEEALVWDQNEMGSIESWRRGIEYGGQGVDDNTSVDGEFITPEAARQRKERVRERRREERDRPEGHRMGSYSGSVISERSERTVRRAESVAGSESTIRRKFPSRSRTEVERSSGARGGSVSGSVKGREIVQIKEKASKKSSALSVIFSKKTKEEKKEKKEKKEKSTSRKGTVVEV